jgi:hypothetical protein
MNTDFGNLHTGLIANGDQNMAAIPNCRSQAEVDFQGAAAVMQTNYNNLREQNNRQAKQLREMAALLKEFAGGRVCRASAAELLKRYAEEIGF